MKRGLRVLFDRHGQIKDREAMLIHNPSHSHGLWFWSREVLSGSLSISICSISTLYLCAPYQQEKEWQARCEDTTWNKSQAH